MRKPVIFLLSLLVLTGCIKAEDLQFRQVEDLSVSIGSTTAVNAVVVMDNNSGSNVRISDAMFHVTDMEGNEIGTVTVAGELLLPKRSTTSVAVPLRIRLSNPLAGLEMMSNIEENAKKMRVNGSAKVKAGILKKKFKVEDVPLSEIISIFTGV
jgi:predicted RecA/RadA family phage recombinase